MLNTLFGTVNNENQLNMCMSPLKRQEHYSLSSSLLLHLFVLYQIVLYTQRRRDENPYFIFEPLQIARLKAHIGCVY